MPDLKEPLPPLAEPTQIQQFMESPTPSREDITTGLQSLRLSMALFLSPYSDMLQREYRDSGRSAFIAPADIQWVLAAIDTIKEDGERLDLAASALRSLHG